MESRAEQLQNERIHGSVERSVFDKLFIPTLTATKDTQSGAEQKIKETKTEMSFYDRPTSVLDKIFFLFSTIGNGITGAVLGTMMGLMMYWSVMNQIYGLWVTVTLVGAAPWLVGGFILGVFCGLVATWFGN